MNTTLEAARAEVISNAENYTVINDGYAIYPVETAALDKWEDIHGDISGDKYDDFCSAVPYVLPGLGTPGNAGIIDFCEELIENGADLRRF